VSKVAAAIGEPARVRMLHSLIDGHARTATELATVANVGASTASAHLNRLRAEHLLKVFTQGKHRYYSLAGSDVARALEALNVVAGRPRGRVTPSTPAQLLLARTCYDHMAGKLGVNLHDRFKEVDRFNRPALGSQYFPTYLDRTSESLYLSSLCYPLALGPAPQHS
jgi:DNA-binding transcriptional ArsR family regulator